MTHNDVQCGHGGWEHGIHQNPLSCSYQVHNGSYKIQSLYSGVIPRVQLTQGKTRNSCKIVLERIQAYHVVGIDELYHNMKKNCNNILPQPQKIT